MTVSINLLVDQNASASGQRFGYDAEGRQTQFFSANNSTGTPDATYSFDGEGKRVKKTSATENTVFVYDASGQLVEEYASGTVQTSYVYAGSTLMTTETSSGTNYLTADHLGSPRIVTDASGNVTSRKDYTAFGEETFTPQRTTGLGYNPQNIRQDYTGYQKDNESGLEYAQARYYNPLHGRFTSTDPLMASATIRDPQTFNRYSYGLNSPYKFTDPLGLIYWEASGACSQSSMGREAGPGGGGAFDSAMWGGIEAPTQQQAQQPATPPQQTDEAASYKTYKVQGSTFEEAVANAKVEFAKQFGEDQAQKCTGGCTGITLANVTTKMGTSYSYTVSGNQVNVTASASGVTARPVVYTPEWSGDGFQKASAADKTHWASYTAGLIDHEKGHVVIANQEARRTNADVRSAMPSLHFSFNLKDAKPKTARTEAAIANQISARLSQVNQIVSKGYDRYSARDLNYDALTEHGKIPRSKVVY